MFQYSPFVYYRRILFNFSINIGSISFFSSSDTHQSHHLLVCHATGINSSFNSFLSASHFSNLVCLIKKAVLTRRKIKRIMLDKKAVLTREKIKGAFSSLRQFLAIESPLKMMKNAFYFASKALFVLKIFDVLTFWSCIETA